MSSPIDVWNGLLGGIDSSEMCRRLSSQMAARRLRFGDRVICPFLRPFFLDAGDEARVRGVAEMLWTLGERIAAEGIRTPQLLADLALSDDEIRLAQIDRVHLAIDLMRRPEPRPSSTFRTRQFRTSRDRPTLSPSNADRNCDNSLRCHPRPEHAERRSNRFDTS